VSALLQLPLVRRLEADYIRHFTGPGQVHRSLLALLDFRGALVQGDDPALIKSLTETAARLGLDELE
jgi:hypothetical protein